MTERAHNVKQVAEHYGVREHTVLSWIHSGELLAVNVGRTPGAKKPRWRITAESLAAFELIRTHNPPPPRTKRRRRQADVIAFY